MIDEIERQRRESPLSFWHPYESNVHPGRFKQAEFLSAREPIKAFFGGNGSGKSIIGTVDDLIQLMDRDAVPSHLRQFKRWEPPFFLRVVGPTSKVLEGVVIEKFRELTTRSQLRGGRFDTAYSKELQKLHFANGSWVLFNTGEQARDAHAGVELHRVRFDEEPPRDIYIENVNRLRRFSPEAQAVFTMTPSLLGGMGWTFDDVYEKREEPHVFVVTASMTENPYVSIKDQMVYLENLSDAERAAVIEGRFVAFQGKVLDRFRFEDDEAGVAHVVDPPSRKHVQSLQVIVGIDPGIRLGGVVWCGFDRDNHMLVFDELYARDMTVPEYVTAIREKNAFWGLQRPQYVIDPSARNRAMTTAETVEGEFTRAGIYAVPGQNDREAGIFQMKARSESNALLVSRGCQNWLKEAARWLVARDEDTEAHKAKAKGAGGSFATMGHDHLMDPTRYACMERAWYRRPAQAQQQWDPSSGTAPPLSYILGRRPLPDPGPLGSFS